MLNIQPSDTDLINELVKDFGRNQMMIHDLVKMVERESKTNLDPIAQAKLKALRRAILVEDVKGQTQKIEMIKDVLQQICSPMESLNV